MSDILDHTSVEDRWIVFTEDLCGRVISVEGAIGKNFHDVPKVLNIFCTLFFGDPRLNDNEAFSSQVLFPSLLVLKFKAISFLFLHWSTKNYIYLNSISKSHQCKVSPTIIFWSLTVVFKPGLIVRMFNIKYHRFKHPFYNNYQEVRR